MRNLLFSASTLIALGLAACSGTDSTPGSTNHGSDMARSDLSRAPAESVSADTLAGTVAANNAFTFDLYGRILEEHAGGNVVASPLSVSLALSMTYAGALGDTASQMASVLHFGAGLDAHAGQNALDQALESRAAAALERAAQEAMSSGAEAPSPDDFRLHIVNSVWGDGTYSWEQPFLDTLAVDYGTGVRLADFIHQPDVERVRINDWVSAETKHKINDLIPEGALTPDSRLVLVNAMHLKMPWANPFSEDQTEAGSFTTGSGNSVNAQFMKQDKESRYYEDEHAQLISLPLAGEAMSLVVALPKATLGGFEAGLDAAAFKAMLDGRAYHRVDLALPRFKFTSDSLSLGKILKEAGMTEAFDDGAANFLGMCAEPPNGERLFISDVVHKAMMAVDEMGVEAAAATAVIAAGSTSVPTEDPIVLRFDRPFMVAIVDEVTGALLFVGHIQDPTAEGGS
ncbi:MAG: serpin family protein [Sorangiineae bacterium]|nr:serpin family protein [Polyangiaceae bacterium]MEB2321280.1 serpin family protein [Sorangiineae bacterium]